MPGKVFFLRSSQTLAVCLFTTFLALAGSADAAQNVTISWVRPSSGAQVAAYRLYQDNQLLCETNDPTATEISCPAEIMDSSSFTVAAVYSTDGGTTNPPPSSNTAPSAQDISISLDEDKAAVSYLKGSDAENDPLSYTIISGPSSGKLQLTDPLTGGFSYTPNQNFSGNDQFTYRVNDGSLDSASATVSLTVKPINDPPVANAGVDQSVFEGQTTVLDGTGSADIDDSIASYSWSQLSGPAANLSDSTVAKPTVAAPQVGSTGAVLTFELTVADKGGLTSTDTVAISVKDQVIVVNHAPSASPVAISVAEDGSVSGKLMGSDPDGDTLTYTIMSAPAHGTVGLLNANTGDFIYTPDNDATGVDSFYYSVSDGAGVSNGAAVNVNITPINDPPVANAGPDQVVKEGDQVALDGTNSYDVDDQLLTYSWVQLDGPAVTVSDPGAAQPQFQAVAAGADSVTLTFQLTVTDAAGLESTDTSSVNVVWVNEPPAASAGVDQTVLEGVEVILDASGSSDVDDGIASYSWLQISGPEMTLSDNAGMQPSFIAPNVNFGGVSMTFEVTVTDFGGLYTKDTAVVNVSWVNVPPVANAGDDQRSVVAGEPVTLDGSLSYDEDDGIAQVLWVQKSGLPVTLSDPTALVPVFDAPADITATAVLEFELTVTDNGGLKHTDICIVEVTPLQTAIIGDLNGNGSLDRYDLGIIRDAIGTCAGQTGYIAGADLDGDSCITRDDLWAWRKL